jgi:hypothetical protein
VNFISQAVLGMLALAVPLSAGRIVINSDEWTLSNTGFANAGNSNASNFAVNLATCLAGPGGSILICSNNFGLTQSSLSATLTAAGFPTTITTGAFSPGGHNAIFLAGSLHSATTSDLVDFVNAGGGVYIAAGTSFSNGGLAASLFNSFLDNFGLAFAGSDVLFSANDSIDDIADPLFTGVTRLFYAGVNPVSVTGSSAAASIAEFRDSTSTFGLIGVTTAVRVRRFPNRAPSCCWVSAFSFWCWPVVTADKVARRRTRSTQAMSAVTRE